MPNVLVIRYSEVESKRDERGSFHMNILLVGASGTVGQASGGAYMCSLSACPSLLPSEDRDVSSSSDTRGGGGRI
ncbi:hypothetical protein EXIGUO8H_20491 [Exiguobacterium sp. 8H]|nr:hypothetical protein EXIGUO8A_11560 [Exiguobacterium sp. 8A]VXB58289.1 hypothetical protein EXIGUO8H_20491 [Exiguobacterium sp. 8H]